MMGLWELLQLQAIPYTTDDDAKEPTIHRSSKVSPLLAAKYLLLSSRGYLFSFECVSRSAGTKWKSGGDLKASAFLFGVTNWTSQLLLEFLPQALTDSRFGTF